MPIDFSTMSPEDELALIASDYPTESPSMVGRILAGINEPMNYLGNRAVSGLHQLGSALYNAATGKSVNDIVSRINEIDAQRQAEDQRRWSYIMGEDGSSLTPIDHVFNVAGVAIPGAGAAKNLVRGAAGKALASSAAKKAMTAGRVAQTIGRVSRTIDEMTPFARGTNFTKDDAIRFLQAAENPNGVRSAVTDIIRNDNALRNSINTYNSIDDTLDMFQRAGRLDPETYAILNNMKSGADIAGDVYVARQGMLGEKLTSAINKAARNKIIEAEELTRAAGENLPRAWQGMSKSELVDIARDNTIREAWLNRLARQDIRSILPDFGRRYVKTGLLGGVGNALGDTISDLPFDPKAEARLAEVALSEPTSLKPTGTDTAVLTKTDAPTATDSPTTIVDSIYDTMDFSHAGIPDSYPSSPTDIVNARPSSSDDGTTPVRPIFEEYQKRLREATEATKKEQEKLIKAYEGLRNMQAMDPYQWETRVLLERQLLDAEKRAANSYRDDSWNKIGAILTAPLTARRLENPFEVWERNVQSAVDRDPEVRRLRRLLGYTNDLPSGSDRAKSEQTIIEQVSKVNFDLLNASVKEQQALIEAARIFNSDVSEQRKKRAETRLKEAQTKREEEETKYVEELNKAKINYYNKGGYRGVDSAVTSFLLNQGAGASPLVGNN